MSGAVASNKVTHRSGRQITVVEATFTLDAASDPTIVSHISLADALLSLVEGPTAVGSGGHIRVTMAHPYARVVHASADYGSGADNTDLYAQKPVMTNVGATDGTPPVALIRLKTGAVSTNPPAAATGNELSVRFVFEDSPIVVVP